MFRAAQWYSTEPKCGAIYLGRCSLHWCLDGPVKVIGQEVVTVRERPRREIVLYGFRLHPPLLRVPLWRMRSYCEHGFRRSAWWHRCDYVTAENPDGRVPNRELYPEDYDENGVHWMDRTCFCDMKPDYSICSMHPDEEDE